MSVEKSLNSLSQSTIQIEYFQVPWYLMPVTESCLRIPKDFGGDDIFHPSNQSTSPHPPTHGLHPTPDCVNDASNQYVIMLEPFREQSMLLIDGVEW